MKFGRNLPRNQVPEWAGAYINYKGLKKLIKTAAERVRRGEGTDTAEFFFTLDRNLEDVDRFYNQKFADGARRLAALQAQYGPALGADAVGLGADEAADALGALLDLRGGLRKLQWFGEVNRRGFVKITKKLDKKVPTHGQHAYVESQVGTKAFATESELTRLMGETNELVAKLGAVPKVEANGDARSGTLTRASSKSLLGLSQDARDAVDRALRQDATDTLQKELDDARESMTDPQDGSFQSLVLELLQRAISYRSRKCMLELLKLTPTLEDKDDINKRNCLHRFVVSMSRNHEVNGLKKNGLERTDTAGSGDYITPAATPHVISFKTPVPEADGSESLNEQDEAVTFFDFILDHLSLEQRVALQARDQYDRLPLHYAAQYGFVALVRTILLHMQDWDQFEIDQSVDAPFWQDLEGMSPLGLSIIGGYPTTTKALVQSEDWRRRHGEDASLTARMGRSGEALALATKRNFVEAVRLLLTAGVDVNAQDKFGETALHVAARFGHDKCAELLLAGNGSEKADTEIVEATFGWTPLLLACVEDQLAMVRLLIDAGADLDLADYSGWTAKEHAALRGNMEILRLLADLTSSPKVLPSSGYPSPNALRPVPDGAEKSAPPVKSFGHRFLTDSSMVLVRLGSADARTNMPVVTLNRIPLAEAHRTQLDTALSLVVHASGAEGEPFVADLPAQDNEPIAFTTRDAGKVKLYFDLVPTYAGSREPVVGRGVAMLGSVRPDLSDGRSGLRGDVTVPIMAAQGLEVLGELRFNFLVVTPFKHKNLEVTEKHTYWKSVATTELIGHRGLGKNMVARRSLQLGENTIQSFIAAASLGASYVEFDVQLTKDHVPVIYHDFLVSETGIDAPMHTLTLAQFLHISDSRSSAPSAGSESPEQRAADATVPGGGGGGSGNGSGNGGSGSAPAAPIKGRSRSLGNADDLRAPATMNERMKHTRAIQTKGFKANSRGSSIQAPFTTLAEMFARLPASVGFNIECKYPMLHEAEENGMDAFAVELNAFADAVLAAVYDRLAGTARRVLFSSFNPDLCVLLALKQPCIPVLFLTDAGCCAVADARASSLQEAVRFASRWNLLGIVSAAEPLVRCPRLVRAVKESGLVCVSYGTLNNDPDNVKLQVQEGIDAVIVDSVLAIRRGLTGDDDWRPTANGTQVKVES